MQITLVLSPALAAVWQHRETSAPASQALRAALGRYERQLRPLHPGTADPELSRYFVMEVSDPSEAKILRDQLSTTAGVEGAYIKPADAPA